MADEKLDDAIDAVVRAVDQMERATRPTVVPAPAPLPPVVRTRVSPGKDAYAPLDSAAGDRLSPGSGHHAPASKAKRKAKKRERAEQAMASSDAGSVTVSAAIRAAAAVPPPQAPKSSATEINELVGEIVTRTAELEEHLEAARELRAEVTELVGRLASVASRTR